MNEQLCHMSVTLADPDETQTAPTFYFYAPCDMVIVYVTAAPHEDDADADIDIGDDGVDVIAAVDAADADVPGTWKATGYGGTNDPVRIAAGSKVTINANDHAASTAFFVNIWYLTGSIFS